MSKDYEAALVEAKANLADLEQRGDGAIGDDWEDVKKRLFTPVELAESDLKISIIQEMIKARQEQGISQYQLEKLSGIKQSQIARLESGNSNPTIFTLQKLLAPLGKKLAVVSI